MMMQMDQPLTWRKASGSASTGKSTSSSLPLPPKIDPTVTMMTLEEKPDVTYKDLGSCKEQIERLREVAEMPLLHP